MDGMERVDENYELKMAAFEADCNDGQGEPVACHHVGEFYSVVKDEHNRSAKVYEKNCYGKNYGPSCFNLARLYLAGKGVEQSDSKAETHFELACKDKHLQACYHQAIMLYYAGEGVNNAPTGQPSPSSAGAKPAAVASSKPSATPSTSSVPPGGVLNEQMIQQKRTEALKLFDWACTEGEYDSCYFSGGHYLDPKNNERDPQKAISYLKKSCAANHAPSCFNLAVLYRKGDTNVPADDALFQEYKSLTERLVSQYGGLSGKKTA